MTRKITRFMAGLLVLLAMLLALSVTGSASASSAVQDQYLYNFQKSVYPWTAGAYCSPLPDYPCDMSAILGLRVDKKYGAYAALYDHGARAVWMRNDFFATGNTIAVKFDAFPVANADRLAPLIYVGYAEPRTLSGFHKLGMPLGKGWQRLGYNVALPQLPPAERLDIRVVVAIGFMNLDGTIAKQAGGIDNVKITFYDVPATAARN